MQFQFQSPESNATAHSSTLPAYTKRYDLSCLQNSFLGVCVLSFVNSEPHLAQNDSLFSCSNTLTVPTILPCFSCRFNSNLTDTKARWFVFCYSPRCLVNFWPSIHHVVPLNRIELLWVSEEKLRHSTNRCHSSILLVFDVRYHRGNPTRSCELRICHNGLLHGLFTLRHSSISLTAKPILVNINLAPNLLSHAVFPTATCVSHLLLSNN